MSNTALRRRAYNGRKREKFAGKEPDAETGLYYYGARYLDPKTARWLSGDPAMGEYLPSAPVNDEARRRNGSLPGQGGVFNYVNLHAYHYAGNNPVKYVDPDGEDGELGIYGLKDFFDFGAFIGVPFIKLFNLFHAAGRDDQAAKNYIGSLWHEATRDTLRTISNASSKATLAFMAVGAIEAAAFTSGVELATNGLLVLDDIMSGNYREALSEGIILVTGVVANKAVGRQIRHVADRAIGISVGKTGRFYEIGRQGAIKTKEAMRAILASDIANGVFGDLTPEVTEQLISKTLKAFDELIK